MTLLLLFNQPPYHETILKTAEQFRDQDEPTVALIMAHTAAELCVERAVSAAFDRRGIKELEEPVTEFFSSYNIGDGRVRKVYSALTGDPIHEQPFWSDFKKSSELRNKAVHRGQTASSEQAQKTCEVVRHVMDHIKGVLEQFNT